MNRLMRFGFLTFILFLMMIATKDAYAAKLRVPKAPASGGTGGTGGGAYSSARLSRPTNSVVITFLNLSAVSKDSYTLSYTANGIQQGVIGSIAPSGQPTDSRDLYFGTCSKGVCTPHYNIKNATLTVTTSLKRGGRYVKLYRIKV